MSMKLIPLATAVLTVDTPLIIKGGPRGTRFIAAIAAAEWTGRINAKQIGSASADWAMLGQDGNAAIDVRTTLKTEDDALIYVSYTGRSKKLSDGSTVLFITPVFETGDSRYGWLNTLQAVGRGTMKNGQLVYEICELE